MFWTGRQDATFLTAAPDRTIDRLTVRLATTATDRAGSRLAEQVPFAHSAIADVENNAATKNTANKTRPFMSHSYWILNRKREKDGLSPHRVAEKHRLEDARYPERHRHRLEEDPECLPNQSGHQKTNSLDFYD